MTHCLRRFAHVRALCLDTAGATVIEFAIVAPVLMLMLMGFFDLAHAAYISNVLQGAVEAAGRASTMQTGAASTGAIDTAVESIVRKTIGNGAQFQSKRLSYTTFAAAGTPERFVDRSPFNNRYDAGECFEDTNDNGMWDADRGRTGQGGAQDIAVYSMTVKFTPFFPWGAVLGSDGKRSITASTVLRNQPYATQTIPTVTQCT